ncbi:MAG: hypothetical protein LBS30_03460, partial [Planctomycetota bacterium]|jgi:hypothetical protein|nr:hypothetical protein [Planctomycetota bacterium]
MLSGIRADADSWSARVRQWGPGFVELWAPPGEWRFAAGYPDGRVEEGGAERLPDGGIRCPLADAAGERVEVRFEKK